MPRTYTQFLGIVLRKGRHNSRFPLQARKRDAIRLVVAELQRHSSLRGPVRIAAEVWEVDSRQPSRKGRRVFKAERRGDYLWTGENLSA